MPRNSASVKKILQFRARFILDSLGNPDIFLSVRRMVNSTAAAPTILSPLRASVRLTAHVTRAERGSAGLHWRETMDEKFDEAIAWGIATAGAIVLIAFHALM